MSNKIDYTFTAIPNQWLTDSKLQPVEKYLLAFLIHITGKDGYIQKKYEILADESGIKRRRLIEMLQNLSRLGYLDKEIQNNRRFSTVYRVRLDRLGGAGQVENRECKFCTPDTKSKNNSANFALQECKKQHLGVQNLHTNQDLNLNLYQEGARVCARAYETETGDGAPVVSMPKPDKSGGNQQKGNSGEFQTDLEVHCLCQAFFEDFKHDVYKFDLVQVDEYICFRPLRIFRDMCEDIFKAAAAWFEARGRVLQWLDTNKHYQNEIIMK